MKNLIAVFAAFVLSTSSLAAGAATEPTVKVVKSRGSRQCEPNSGVSPEIMQAELEKAGVAVKSRACGQDGRVYPAVCGAPDGAVNIFEIPENQMSLAQSLGFGKLSELPDAREVPCQ